MSEKRPSQVLNDIHEAVTVYQSEVLPSGKNSVIESYWNEMCDSFEVNEVRNAREWILKRYRERFLVSIYSLGSRQMERYRESMIDRFGTEP